MSQAEPIIVVNGAHLSISQSEAVHFAISYLLAELNEAETQEAFAGVASTYQVRLREVMAILTGQPFSMSYCCRNQGGRQHMHAADVQRTAAAETPTLQSMLGKENEIPPHTRDQVDLGCMRAGGLSERRMFSSRLQLIEPRLIRKQLVAR